MVQVCPLGKGAFGTVMLVKWNNEFCALKQISKALVVKSQLVNHIKAEKRLMAECDCPFLVRLQAAFQDKTHLYLVMDFVQGGELFTFMRKRRRALREAWARFYAATVICGFAYLSARDIVYRCAPHRALGLARLRSCGHREPEGEWEPAPQVLVPASEGLHPAGSAGSSVRVQGLETGEPAH